MGRGPSARKGGGRHQGGDNFQPGLEIGRPPLWVDPVPPRRLRLNNTGLGDLSVVKRPRGVKLHEKHKCRKYILGVLPRGRSNGSGHYQRCTHDSKVGRWQWFLQFRGGVRSVWAEIPIVPERYHARCEQVIVLWCRKGGKTASPGGSPLSRSEPVGRENIHWSRSWGCRPIPLLRPMSA